MFRVKSPQEIGAAATFILLGAAGLWFGRPYEVGHASRMGPGYVPALLSWGLILFGLVTGVRGGRVRGPAIGPVGWRTGALVLAAILGFGLLIESAGLALAVFVLTLLSALASADSRWRETIALGVFLALLCVAVFVYGLRQPMSVFVPG